VKRAKRIAVLNKKERGGSLDAESSYQIRLVVDVDLADDDFACQRFGRLIHRSLHQVARNAPGCPKVEEDRPLAIQHDRVEILVRYVRRLHTLEFAHVCAVGRPWDYVKFRVFEQHG